MNAFTSHTTASAATIDCTRGTGSKSSGGGTLGRRLPCRTCSIDGRRCKTRGLLSGATSGRAGSGCEGRRGRGFSLGRARDPRQRSFPNRFFLQPLDLLQMIRPVFRHHPHIVGNRDPVIEFRMAG